MKTCLIEYLKIHCLKLQNSIKINITPDIEINLTLKSELYNHVQCTGRYYTIIRSYIKIVQCKQRKIKYFLQLIILTNCTFFYLYTLKCRVSRCNPRFYCLSFLLCVKIR